MKTKSTISGGWTRIQTHPVGAKTDRRTLGGGRGWWVAWGFCDGRVGRGDEVERMWIRGGGGDGTVANKMIDLMMVSGNALRLSLSPLRELHLEAQLVVSGGDAVSKNKCRYFFQNWSSRSQVNSRPLLEFHRTLMIGMRLFFNRLTSRSIISTCSSMK
ncbi:hypothetical protein Tco_1082124 [Tanacetum coccineum]|uniref:Uncharacterized protein n=1 Tax=Tanacetum coccineum TaxID=301880 RepID=A0ABQ5HZK9_9ASTR